MKFVTDKFLSTEELEDFSICRRSIDGSEHWTDQDGRAHREDGPAYTSSDGSTKHWFNHGQIHRLDGPAIDRPDCKGWLKNNHYHREDGPAYVDNQGSIFYLNGIIVEESSVRALGKMK
jgi:hypothetical protein